ncbi:MAG: tail fiber protein [Actinomycetota bacterium]|nr:tail fiber protein [Actinomycetota bacterium]
MAQPYVGEIRMFGGNFAPVGWMFCEGQQLPISENETLYQLIGTTYGGDGQETFNLPDLQGRVPVHMGNTIQLAEKTGVESVTLTTQQIPVHSHAYLAAKVDGNNINPVGNTIANSFQVTPYISETPSVPFNAAAITPTGGSQPHENLQPYLCVDFIISLFGIFPSQT